MSQKTQEKILDLVKIKSWYLPGDTETYNTLRSLKLPLLKIHVDFMPVLLMRLKAAKLRVRSRPLRDIVEAYLDKVGTAWQAKEGRKARITGTRLSFRAKNTMKNKEAVQKLDIALAKFFERWGFKYIAVFSTEGEVLRLVVDYEFDASRNPVLTTVVPENLDVYEMVLGFTKIKFTFHNKRTQVTETKTRALPPIIQTEILIQSGTEWKLAHTSTCVDSQVGDPSQFMAAMGVFQSRFVINDN